MSREVLKRQAFEARELYQRGLITRSEAKSLIDPYLMSFNIFSKEKAKEFGVRPRTMSFSAFTRI